MPPTTPCPAAPPGGTGVGENSRTHDIFFGQAGSVGIERVVNGRSRQVTIPGLANGATAMTVAQASDLDALAVEAHADLFFNVLDRRESPCYLIQTVAAARQAISMIASGGSSSVSPTRFPSNFR